MTNAHLSELAPQPLWSFFKLLADTPRPSEHEAAIVEKLEHWADSKGFAHERDGAGNLLIRKPATAGCEQRQTIVIQGHVDMVAQANQDSEHNFLTDSIATQIQDGWLTATGTTLGADNGLGVAAGLAILDADDIQHGPVELLLTIEEESSMRGALELRENWLQGKWLLNLDSEDRGDVYVGCAGGVDVNVNHHLALQSNDNSALKILFTGLRGGHSGLDIDKGRGNANRLLIRALNVLQTEFSFRLASFNGGTLRNAIPREAEAVIALAAEQQDSVIAALTQQVALFNKELAETDHELVLKTSTVQADLALSDNDSRQLINVLNAAPCGVEQMSNSGFAGVVETSNNLGIVTLKPSTQSSEQSPTPQADFEACLLVRSLKDSATQALAERIRSCFQLIGADVEFDGAYPGWTPNAKSDLLQYFQHCHKELMGQEAHVKVIHAGLECGIIGAKYPALDMISFGPLIRGAHSPEERVELQSVEEFWQLLTLLVQRLP
ncbi:aminoacyl-histidine dipeptidase [Oceanospirillum sediminis]|uniref:Cytosol non-specific dipeptidase n=1 Tax=Oceanospirillum sediminis TaxID=2760088 RepID=A0A839INY9_9GAMM|nr:aminoacyl-histidine dipeptidase [Oceanospirillum sediminis]MBB1486400.1 aminoacyl-histidine dipeptidase [Oceanospirillum sediminis]